MDVQYYSGNAPNNDFSKSFLSTNHTIKDLCGALIMRPNGQAGEGDGKSKWKSASQLESLFWRMIFEQSYHSPAPIALPDRMMNAFADYVMQDGMDARALSVVKLIETVRQNSALVGEDILHFLLDLQQVGQWSADRPVEPTVMSQLFKSFGKSQEQQLLRTGSVFDIFRPVIAVPESTPTPDEAAVIRPQTVTSISDSEKAPPQKHFIGDLLTDRQVSHFHGACSIQAAQKAGRLPVVPERFLEELKRIVLGTIDDSAIYDWNESTGTYSFKAGLCVLGFSLEATEKVAGFAGDIGSCVRRVGRATTVPVSQYRRHPGQTFAQFIAAVQVYLEGFRANVVERAKNVRNFLHFAVETEPVRLPIEFVDQICSLVFAGPSEIGLPIRGLSLLQLLYERCLEALGTAGLGHLSLFLLEETAKPFFTFVTALAVRGDVRDPYSEFPIVINKSLFATEGFWEGVLDFQDSSESFLWDFIQDAVRAAKSLYLLRIVCPNHPMLPAVNAYVYPFQFGFNMDPRLYRQEIAAYAEEAREKIDRAVSRSPVAACGVSAIDAGKRSNLFEAFSGSASNSTADLFTTIWDRYHGSFKTIVHQELLSVINIQVQLADSAVVKLFQNHLQLNSILLVLKDYFFLENGEFSSSFVASLYEKAASSSLKDCLDYFQLVTFLENSLSDRTSISGDLLKKLSLLSTHCSVIERTASSFDVSDYIGLGYKIEWPLSMIITPVLIGKCDKLFRRLLRIRGCTWVLNDAFIALSEARGVENAANRCVISVYRHEMAHFIGVLDAHLREVAIRRPWLELQEQLTAATCWEEMRDSVALYIHTVYDLCVLEEAPFPKFFRYTTEIFRLVTRFYTELRSEASFQALQRTFQLFQHCAYQIYQCAEAQCLPLNFDVDSFMAQIDFSRYIQTTRPATVRRRSKRGDLRSPVNPYGTL